MEKQLVSLDVIDVVSPCHVPWDSMQGDDRVRFCGQCQMNVYNLSEMPRTEAEALVNTREGRMCARFFRRPDGTILTQDCSVVLRVIRRRMAKLLTGIAAVMSFLTFGAIAARSSANQDGSGQGSAGGPLTRIAEWLDPPQYSGIAGDICLPVRVAPPSSESEGSE